jgi:predicted secreted Zn-dependent protease
MQLAQVKVKVNVKVTLGQEKKAQRGSRSIALLFL